MASSDNDISATLGTAGVAAFAFIGMIPIVIFFSSLFSGIGAWILGWFFGDVILTIFAKLGLTGVTMFQLGVFGGFVGSFLRTKVETTVKEK